MKKMFFESLLVLILVFTLAFPLTNLKAFAEQEAQDSSVDPPGSSFDTAIKLSGRQEGTFSSYADYHFYTFTVPDSCRITVWLSTSDDTGYKYASLYDGACNFLTSQSVKSGGKGVDYYVLAGTYYIRTTGPTNGGYSLSLSRYTNAGETISESQTQRYNTISNAAEITFDTLYAGLLGINDSADSFAFDLPHDGIVTVNKFYAQYEHNGQFYDSQGKAEGNAFKTKNGEENIYSIALSKGTHYIIITGEDGQYNFSLVYTPDETQHVFGKWSVVTEATCTKSGTRQRTCIDCGAIETETIPAGHKLTKTDAVEATCTEEGNSAYWTCSSCGKHFSDAAGKNEIEADSWIIGALGHQEEMIPAVIPTCTEPGLTEGSLCSVCGNVIEEQKVIDALGHDLKHHDAKSPTCTEAGWEAYDTCSRCDYTTYKEIASLGHDLIHHEGKAATCTEAGWEAYDTCSRCDYTTYKEIAALDHDLIHHEGKTATCTEAGWVAYDTCNRCDYTTYKEIPAHGHSLVKTEAVEATAEEAGNSEYWTCSVCGKYYSDAEGRNEIAKDSWIIPATGHDWDAGVITIEPTCTGSGVRVFTCKDCGQTRTEEVLPLGHDLKHHDAKAATCTEAGWEAYDACTRCDYTTYKEIAALDHDWGEWEVVTPATEDAEGLEVRTCKNDKTHKEERAISKLGHAHDLVKTGAKAASCTEAGNSEYWTCADCGKFYSDAEGRNEITKDSWVIPATGHSWNDGEVSTQATTTSTGITTYTCQACGETREETIARINASEALKEGASEAAAEQVITNLKNDNDPAGTTYGLLQLRSTSQTKTKITLVWNKLAAANKYVIYGNACGTKNRMKRLGEVKGSAKTKAFTKVAGKKVKKGTYYKFIIVAVDSNGKVIGTSKIIHVATKGGKVGNHKSVTIASSVITAAKNLKKGKSIKLNAKQIPQSSKLTVKKHRVMKYETSNPEIARVTNKGNVKGMKKGICYIYAYAQNGIAKRIKVVVK